MTPLRCIAGSTALALLLSACDRPDDGAEAEGTPRGGTAVLAEAADMTLPTPLTAAVVMDGNLADVMYMGMTRGAWQDGRLVHLTAERSPMALARSYEFAGADSTRLRFHMRGDVRWSDSVAVTAADAVFTYTLARDPAVGFAQRNYIAQIDSVVAENDSTVSFFFARRYPEMVAHASIGLLPRHRFSDVPAAAFRTSPALLEPGGGALVVSGAFQIDSYTRGREIALVPNPHFAPRPHLDRIVIRIIPEATTRLVELETGAVDFVASIPSDQATDLLARRPEMRATTEEGRYYEFVTYNTTTFPAFADRSVRRALRQAIDTDQIFAALELEGFATPAGGPYSPIFTDLYDAEAMAPPPFDTLAAREALASAGWSDSDGDGVLDRAGEPFRFTLETNSESRRRGDLSVLLQSQWRRIGVDAQLRQGEQQALMGRMQAGDYQAVLAGWGVGLSPDLTEMWGPEAPFNFARYRNPALDSLFDAALSQPTEEAAAPYWRRAATLLAADQPYNWLYYYAAIGVVGPRLQGMRVDTYGAYQNVWEWRVEE